MWSVVLWSVVCVECVVYVPVCIHMCGCSWSSSSLDGWVVIQQVHDCVSAHVWLCACQ